ncbi:AraC family transcriptional regulator [Xylanibacillus composti]|nr:GyrI-like domain-containing protein [Xylanibacillus composti]
MSRKDYVSKVNQVLDYINNHLDRELPLHELSEIAHYSPFHFHRIFKSLVRENPNEFIQRVRIEKAANLLLHQPDCRITEIAMQCGFSSPSVFARAFRAHFGTSANSFRNHFRKNGKVAGNLEKVRKIQMDYYRKVEIKTLPSFHVAYHRCFTGYDKGVFNNDIFVSFRKVEQWLASRNLFSEETVCMGITYDNPDITARDKCRYDAAFSIPNEITEASGEIGIQQVEGGLYAVCREEGERMEDVVQKIGETVDFMYGQWLLDSSFQLADKPCLEIYCQKERHDGSAFMIDYCLPLLPK